VKPYYEDEAVTIYHGDCREVLPGLEADAVITDPPYNVGKDYGPGHDDAKEKWAHIEWLHDLLALSAEASRGPVVFFPGRRYMLDAEWMVADTGLRIVRCLGWHRKEFAGDKWNGGPAMCWEPIVWASSEDKPTFNTIFGTYGRDFLVVPSTHGDPYAQLHPCPKPLAVMKWLVGLFVPEMGLVLDPFVGTGTTLRAAKDLGRRAIGIEIEERYCEIAVERLAQEVLDLEMAA
jgi:site-specific DNA-methyltransferase (adenine-specific)